MKKKPKQLPIWPHYHTCRCVTCGLRIAVAWLAARLKAKP